MPELGEPRVRTEYVVAPSTPEEQAAFREQERQRFATPERPFTYRLHGYESVVPPVRRDRVQEGSILLSAAGRMPGAPPSVSLMGLIRDAIARLPNGVGTRNDICTLLHDSGYINFDECLLTMEDDVASEKEKKQGSKEGRRSRR